MKQLLLCFWAYVSCQCKSHVQINSNIQKSRQSSRALFESGEMAVTLPTAVRSPPLRALRMSLHAKQLQLAGSTFPRGLLYLSQLLQTASLSPVTKCQRDYSGLGPSLSILEDQDDVNPFVTVFVRRPAFEEGTSHRLTVSEQNDTTRFDQLSPDSHSRKYRHHFKLLDDCSLLFGHYVV